MHTPVITGPIKDRDPVISQDDVQKIAGSSPAMTIEEGGSRQPETQPHHTLPQRQRKQDKRSDVVAPAREQTAGRTPRRKTKTPARERAKRRGAAKPRPGLDKFTDVFAKAKNAA
jgi:hypothetical protein